MTKFIKIIRFVKKYRKLGIGSFRVETTSDEFILIVYDYTKEDILIHDQIRLKYKS